MSHEENEKIFYAKLPINKLRYDYYKQQFDSYEQRAVIQKSFLRLFVEAPGSFFNLVSLMHYLGKMVSLNKTPKSFKDDWEVWGEAVHNDASFYNTEDPIAIENLKTLRNPRG
ncbi:hypothetical protein [Aureibacillus halotolerans]|uniref:hypothetical protein n=1 Tax=Aureibacillus halotolerans TaxID=1508390 RepID=UPI001061E105|nr:hypothetical protein [Aureibacillus halotolerans]